MITSFSCPCCKGTEAKEYDGLLGYESIICKNCGTTIDHTGISLADDFSRQYVGLKPLPLVFTKPITEYKVGEYFNYHFTALDGSLQSGSSPIKDISPAFGKITIILLENNIQAYHGEI